MWGSVLVWFCEGIGLAFGYGLGFDMGMIRDDLILDTDVEINKVYWTAKTVLCD